MNGTARTPRQIIFRYFEPASVALIVLFWSLMPASITTNPMTLLWAGIITKVVVVGLEFVNERHSGWRLDRRELLTDIFYVLLGYTIIQYANDHVTDASVLALKHAVGFTTPWLEQSPVVVQVALILFISELGQYWLHRAMHNWRPLWLVHAPHHHITQLNALKGLVGNPIELVLVYASVIALFDFSLPALFCAGQLFGATACFAHANVKFEAPKWYASIFTTVSAHSLHHSVQYEDTRCNYANSLICLDHLFGTFRAGETDTVGQDDRRRLSIKEQMLFPVMPLIESWNARGKAAS